MVEKIEKSGQLLAIIIRNNYGSEGIEFFTPNLFSQQLASMGHPKGKVIAPHTHNLIPREVHQTQEVLIIKKGKLRVDFYLEDRTYLESRVLSEGDIILLSDGGHGFEVLEDIQMVEVKQGPYAGENDKIRFEPVDSAQIKIR